jgi:hypothetical protein
MSKLIVTTAWGDWQLLWHATDQGRVAKARLREYDNFYIVRNL